ncbi:ER membrane protein complex subunit 1 isoform X2 [Plodia interpunctella]|uniref:ER membrane protein complex subunit 1 isoform X2 n=1 Tax=Plodia interpunctella TaxID=58824 RepID=UPI00236860DB|nr:ER membrane protein complex subunit 1 isoform X2 [Plodia interpunctella]
MGMLLIRFKPNFLGLLKSLNSINWLIVFFSLLNLSECIYEDQIGKFDWRQTYVGRIKFSQFDTVSTAKKIIVATEENVLAALNLKTGQVVWRHVFETGPSGNIQLLHLSENVVTITGSNPYLVRGWDSDTGVLLWEWSLTLQSGEAMSQWSARRDVLVHVQRAHAHSALALSQYALRSGHNSGLTSKLPAPWVNDGCILSGPYYICISGPEGSENLIALDVTSNTVQIISKPLSTFTAQPSPLMRPLSHNTVTPGVILNGKVVVLIKDNSFEVAKVQLLDRLASALVTDTATGPILVQTWTDDSKQFHLHAHSLQSGQQLEHARPPQQQQQQQQAAPQPELAAVTCARACRVLVTGADHSVHLLQLDGRVLWSREEALAAVVAVEFVDLPVSDLDAAIESEFDQKEGSIWAAFSRRLHTQFQQLHTLLTSFDGQSQASKDSQSPLVRDYFNLHKIIVLVTKVGKIFGMDNLSGEILWSRHEPALDARHTLLFTRRSARHPPLDAYLTIVGKHVETKEGLIISINPIRGTPVGERFMKLDTQLLQVAILPNADEEKLHALVLLDSDENVQVLPGSAAPLVENLFMYVAHKDTAKVNGYALRYDGRTVTASRTWSLQLQGHRIAALRGKPRERVHSPGRVLGDRQLLYKYLNPNLVLFVTEGPDLTHKDVVVATCVDAVSGAVVTSQAQRRARATPLAVHTENFMAYLYYNDKHRRTEIATMELYSGHQRWLGAHAAFSSLSASLAPLVDRAAYILPQPASAVAGTATERSLTDKHVLLAMSTGAIIEMPWAFLRPQRPVSPTPETQEEGLIPYAPELPLPADAIINYNNTLHRIHAIYTAPSGLESTSLVLATGLDLFYTRVAPSKTFDLLKDDFDYYLITIVLVGLIVASYSTKYFASRKMLKMAWK